MFIKEKNWKLIFYHRVLINIEQTLHLYDFFPKEDILIKNFGGIRHESHLVLNDKLLSIGTIYGKVMIINVEIIVDKIDSRNLVYLVPKLELIKLIQYEHSFINSNKNNTNNSNYENRSYILIILMKFSIYDDFLAISYGNEIGKDGKFQGGNMIPVYILRLNKKIQIVNKRGMNNDFYLKDINITIPDNQYQIINMNKIETATTNIKLNEILKILEFKNQEIKLNSILKRL